MRKVWIIARHEYLVNVRRVGFIAALALVPVLGSLGLLIAAFFGGQASSFLERQFASQSTMTGVVDEVGLFSPILPQYEGSFRIYADEQAGRAAVLSGEIGRLLVIPGDYVANGKVKVMARQSGLGSLDRDDSRAFFVDHLLRNRLDPVWRTRVIEPFDPVVVDVESDGRPGQGTWDVVPNTMVAYFFGLLLVITIFTSSSYLLRSVSEEKSTRVIEVILSSVGAGQLLMGKVLGLGALGLTQVVVWLASAFGLSLAAESILGVSVPLVGRPDIFVMGIVYFLLGFLVYAVLLGSVGALGTTMQESQQLAGIFSFMAAIPLMVGGMAMANPNTMLMRVLSWFPFTSPTMMLLRFPMAEVPAIDVIGSVVVLVLTVPAVLWAGAKLFRAGLLMYGKRPALRQVFRVLREA